MQQQKGHGFGTTALNLGTALHNMRRQMARANHGSYSSDYIQIRSPVYVPHSAGRYAAKRFRKANCPIIERLTNSLMMHGRNNGKKLMAVRIVAHAFEIVRQPIADFSGSRKGSHTLKNAPLTELYRST